MYHPQVYKTGLCEHFDENDPSKWQCVWKRGCAHAHGKGELRSKAVAIKLWAEHLQQLKEAGKPGLWDEHGKTNSGQLSQGRGEAPDVLYRLVTNNIAQSYSVLHVIASLDPSLGAAIANVPPSTLTAMLSSVARNPHLPSPALAFGAGGVLTQGQLGGVGPAVATLLAAGTPEKVLAAPAQLLAHLLASALNARPALPLALSPSLVEAVPHTLSGSKGASTFLTAPPNQVALMNSLADTSVLSTYSDPMGRLSPLANPPTLNNARLSLAPLAANGLVAHMSVPFGGHPHMVPSYPTHPLMRESGGGDGESDRELGVLPPMRMLGSAMTAGTLPFALSSGASVGHPRPISSGYSNPNPKASRSVSTHSTGVANNLAIPYMHPSVALGENSRPSANLIHPIPLVPSNQSIAPTPLSGLALLPHTHVPPTLQVFSLSLPHTFFDLAFSFFSFPSSFLCSLSFYFLSFGQPISHSQATNHHSLLLKRFYLRSGPWRR
jgi:hypothetical protein